MDFLKDWGPPIATIIVMCLIYWAGREAGKREKKKKEGENIKERLIGVERVVDKLFILYPQLKSLEKLEELNLTQEDIRKTVSEALKGIKKEVDKKFSDMDKAIAALVAQKVNEAEKRFKKPVADADDYLILGNAEYAGENYAEAIKYYDKAIELKPDFALAWINKGVTLGKLGSYDDEINAYDKAIELKPDDVLAWSNKGAVLINLKRYDDALKACDKAIELKPDDAAGWYNKACVYSLMGDKTNALQNLSKAIELDATCKEDAKKDKDEDFKGLWDDEDFKRITS